MTPVVTCLCALLVGASVALAQEPGASTADPPPERSSPTPPLEGTIVPSFGSEGAGPIVPDFGPNAERLDLGAGQAGSAAGLAVPGAVPVPCAPYVAPQTETDAAPARGRMVTVAPVETPGDAAAGSAATGGPESMAGVHVLRGSTGSIVSMPEETTGTVSRSAGSGFQPRTQPAHC